MKNLKNIIAEAEKALKSMKDGETFTAEKVIKDFEKAASKNPHDQLIGNMRDILVKRASKKMFFNQNEISELYQDMYGMSGGHTAFRDCLGQYLPESMQFSKVAYQNSPLRTKEEVNPEPIYKDSELSNAFSVLFSLGNDSAFSSYKRADSKDVQKAVLNKLSKLGKVPVQVNVNNQNEHFALASATYQDRRHNQLTIQIPVPIVDGVPREPELMIQAGDTIPLTKNELYVHLKEKSNYKKASRQSKFGGHIDSSQVKVDKVVVPKTLEKWADFDTDMIKVAGSFSSDQVNLGASMVSSEISSYAKVNSQIKVANSDKSGITFRATFPSPKGGDIAIDIPVEYHNGSPILPNRFLVNASNDSIHKYYDFDQKGFDSLWSHMADNSYSHEQHHITRIASKMGQMSYHQLMDQVIQAAADKNYKLAEDAIGVIEARFGDEMAKKALSDYGNLLKHASPTNSRRKEFIKTAQERGQLINVPTTIEPYSPQLGLPVSKIDFDHEGNMYPKGRLPKYDNQNDEVQVISTSKIHLT